LNPVGSNQKPVIISNKQKPTTKNNTNQSVFLPQLTTQIFVASFLRIKELKVAYPAVDILAGPAASVREAKRLIQAGADGIVAGTGCDVGGDPQAPQAVALGRGEASMVYEVEFGGDGWTQT